GDELHQLLSLQLWRAAGERPWMLGGGCSRHTGVPPTTDPTQVAMFTNPQLVQCRGQLTGTVATELISLSRAERTQLRWNDLALLAERAGHQADLGSLFDVTCHRATRGDRFVVRVGMDQQ